MSEEKFSFSGSFQKTKEYVDTQVELLKLKAIARSSRIMGAMVLDATKLLLTLIIVFFLSLALGFYLGELMNSNALGFLSTGGIFLIILLVIRAFEPKLEAKFMDLTIRKVLGKWNQEDDLLTDMEREHEKAKSSAKEEGAVQNESPESDLNETIDNEKSDENKY